MKIEKIRGIVTAFVLSVTVLLTDCGNGTMGKISSQDNGGSSVSAPETESSSNVSSAADDTSSGTDKDGPASSKPNHQSSTSSHSQHDGNTGKPTNSWKPDNSGSANKPSHSGNESSQPSQPNNGGSEKPAKPENSTDTQPSVHTHNFVDVGVQSMDWTYAQEPGYTGPTNTREKVSAINACLRCGQYFGGEEVFADRFFEHVFGPDADCDGNYSLRMVFVCYHLLECSTPGCYSYRRGDLDHYEYLIYFNGNGEEPTPFILEDWQIKELGLPMPEK